MLLETQIWQVQSRSAKRRRRQASPRRGPNVAGSGTSPDGSDDSGSDHGSASKPSPNISSSGKFPISPRRRHAEPSGPMSLVAPFGPEALCIPGQSQARKMFESEVDPWLASQISDLSMVKMLINTLFLVLLLVIARRGS